MKDIIKAMIAQGGTTLQRLVASGMNINSLRTNTTLRKDEWVDLDRAIVEAAQDRLVGVADLLSRNLRYSLTNGLGKTVLESENVSDMRDAVMSMDGQTKGENDTVDYGLVGLPLPLVHKDYSINARKLAASRNLGEPLDVTQARLAARKVADKVEDVLFNGETKIVFGGYSIYGYTTFTSRNTGTLANDWAGAAVAGKDIVGDVLEMKQDLIDKKQFGPYMLYVPPEYETKLDDDYSNDKGDNTIRDRIKKISGIIDVKVADKLATKNVLLVQMTMETVRMVEGLPLTNVEWQEQGGMVFLMKVMAITVPQLRTDNAGNCGICHYSK